MRIRCVQFLTLAVLAARALADQCACKCPKARGDLCHFIDTVFSDVQKPISEVVKDLVETHIKRAVADGTPTGNPIGSKTPKPSADPSILVILEQKMAEMEARLAKKIESRARDISHEVCGQREDILKKVSEAVHGTVLRRLKNAEKTFIMVDHHLVSEVERAHDRILRLEKEIPKADILQVKMNDTQEMLNSFIASHKESEAVIGKNITAEAGNLKLFLNDSLNLGFQEIHSNFTAKIRDLEMRIQRDCANSSRVSEMDESMRNREKAVQEQFQTLRSQLEDRCEELNKTLIHHSSLIAALNEETFDIQVRLFSCDGDPPVLPNGKATDFDRKPGSKVPYECDDSYVLNSPSTVQCNRGHWEGQPPVCIRLVSCDGDPPVLPNGKAIDFERKHGSKVRYECDENYVLASPSTVHCSQGDWEGQPPVCSYFDATFYLWTSIRGRWIECHSDFNSWKITFSRVLDAGSGTRLEGSRERGTNFAIFRIDHLSSFESYGSLKCGFSDERASMNIAVQRQNVSGDLYFEDHSKVANIGDDVDLEVRFNKDRSIGWRHNGVDVPSWRNRGRVEIPSVEPSDAGIYECNYEGQRGVTAPALLRLIVRKCKKNLFGEHCDQQCPPCYNGGICHDHLGVCVCPPGFRGNNCEVSCDRGSTGPNCKFADCMECLFCLPDPYGCSCARGWTGFGCDERCKRGWYGPDCKQPCHCALGSADCDRFAGVCPGGCSPGWTGESCQIQVVD